METGKRKFSGSRLYKLAIFLVIVISILSGLLACGEYLAIEYSSEQISKFDEEQPKKKSKKAPMFGVENIYVVAEIQRRQKERFQLFSLIAIGLPIIFFGGTGLYRYLSPLNGQELGR